MRRNEEEFKAEIFRRCDRYKKEQHKRRKIAAGISTSALCVLVVSAALIFTNPSLNFIPESTGLVSSEIAMGTENKDIYGAVDNVITDKGDADDFISSESSVISMDIELYENSENSVKHYTDSDKIAQIINCISSMEFSEFDGTVEESAAAYGFTITAVNEDGTTNKYAFIENGLLRENDGDWLKVDAEQAENLERLIKSLLSD